MSFAHAVGFPLGLPSPGGRESGGTGRRGGLPPLWDSSRGPPRFPYGFESRLSHPKCKPMPVNAEGWPLANSPDCGVLSRRVRQAGPSRVTCPISEPIDGSAGSSRGPGRKGRPSRYFLRVEHMARHPCGCRRCSSRPEEVSRARSCHHCRRRVCRWASSAGNRRSCARPSVPAGSFVVGGA